MGEAPQLERTNKSAQRQAIVRTVREHDRTDTRWLDYEMDVSKLLDYPLMTDMRDPLTQRFHRAKLRADLLRPADAADLLDDSGAARDYRDAVEEYVTAFDVAEAEAIRKRRTDFSREEQQRLSRAHSALRIATDTAATPQERERAFDVARRELDGLIVLPERTRAAASPEMSTVPPRVHAHSARSATGAVTTAVGSPAFARAALGAASPVGTVHDPTSTSQRASVSVATSSTTLSTR